MFILKYQNTQLHFSYFRNNENGFFLWCLIICEPAPDSKQKMWLDENLVQMKVFAVKIRLQCIYFALSHSKISFLLCLVFCPDDLHIRWLDDTKDLLHSSKLFPLDSGQYASAASDREAEGHSSGERLDPHPLLLHVGSTSSLQGEIKGWGFFQTHPSK